MAGFSCEVRLEGAVRVLHVRGEIDIAVADEFWRVLEPLLTAGTLVAMECSGVSFFDSMGLRVVVKAQNRAEETGAAFVLAGPSGAVARVLELSGVTGMFTTYPGLERALAALTGKDGARR